MYRVTHWTHRHSETVTEELDPHTPSDWTPAALLTRWSASSMASAGPRGKSRDKPITRMRISVSSSRGTSEQRRRKKLRKERKRHQLLAYGLWLVDAIWRNTNLKPEGRLTFCHSQEASCPTCNMSQVALWKALCEGCRWERWWHIMFNIDGNIIGLRGKNCSGASRYRPMNVVFRTDFADGGNHSVEPPHSISLYGSNLILERLEDVQIWNNADTCLVGNTNTF